MLAGKEFAVAGWVLLGAHLPTALVEGLVTGSVVVLLRKVRPEVLRSLMLAPIDAGGARWISRQPWGGDVGQVANSASTRSTLLSWRSSPCCLAAAPASAHELNVFAYVEGTTIHGKAYFRGGSAGPERAVIARDPAGKELARTTTDEQGKFSLEARVRCDHVLDGRDGRRPRRRATRCGPRNCPIACPCRCERRFQPAARCSRRPIPW